MGTLPEYLFRLHVIGMFRKGGGRGQCRQYISGRDLTLTLGVKQMLFFLNGGNMPAFSVVQAKPRGGEIICIMQSQSVHLLVESLERKTALC